MTNIFARLMIQSYITNCLDRPVMDIPRPRQPTYIQSQTLSAIKFIAYINDVTMSNFDDR
jgi:hypothetical protein